MEALLRFTENPDLLSNLALHNISGGNDEAITLFRVVKKCTVETM